MINDALFYDSYEIIGDEKFMSPAANLYHNRTLFRLGIIIGQYTIEHKCGYVFTDSVDVYLPDGNIFRPDLVAEVLSKSTMRRDTTIKKDIYEANGVKEYRIVDPWKESISVYHLHDGKYIFDDEYVYYDKDEWDDLTDEQRVEAKFDIKVSIFDDCIVNINDVFDWLIF